MAICHLVMMRFAPDFLTDAYVAYTRRIYQEIADSLPGICAVNVYQNCIQRDGNFDLMVKMELLAPEDLPAYLVHPRHLEFVESHAGQIFGRASFDYNMEIDSEWSSYEHEKY